MSAKFFLDTNIFVYEMNGAASSKQAIAAQLIEEALHSANGVVSFQVVQEFFNVALRRFNPPMSTAEAEQVLALTFRPLLAVHSSVALYAQALQLVRQHSVSWYDSLIICAALESDCRILYSEDLQNGRRFGNLLIRNPFL
jgi:predicted nucleic acid-binding protein